jgi:hypothetical protein
LGVGCRDIANGVDQAAGLGIVEQQFARRYDAKRMRGKMPVGSHLQRYAGTDEHGAI